MALIEHLRWLKSVNTPEVFFIIRLQHHGQITWEEKDIEFARIYNIPNCCRDNYIMMRRVGLPPYRTMKKVFGPDPVNVEYVRCNHCRKERRITWQRKTATKGHERGGCVK